MLCSIPAAVQHAMLLVCCVHHTVLLLCSRVVHRCSRVVHRCTRLQRLCTRGCVHTTSVLTQPLCSQPRTTPAATLLLPSCYPPVTLLLPSCCAPGCAQSLTLTSRCTHHVHTMLHRGAHFVLTPSELSVSRYGQNPGRIGLFYRGLALYTARTAHSHSL